MAARKAAPKDVTTKTLTNIRFNGESFPKGTEITLPVDEYELLRVKGAVEAVETTEGAE